MTAQHGGDRLERLGRRVEIISGREEARLIYLGVAHSTAGSGRRLVVDIGGGSTELIVGEQFEPQQLESLYMGCVSLTRRWFDGERIRESALRAADLAVRMELEPVEAHFRDAAWDEAIGASGTIKAIRDVLVALGWSDGDIPREALRRLRADLIDAAPAALASRFGLARERAAVFAGGLAVLYGIFEALGVERMKVSDGALREGLIFDLLGRVQHEDVRDRSVRALAARHSRNRASRRPGKEQGPRLRPFSFFSPTIEACRQRQLRHQADAVGPALPAHRRCPLGEAPKALRGGCPTSA